MDSNGPQMVIAELRSLNYARMVKRARAIESEDRRRYGTAARIRRAVWPILHPRKAARR